MFQPRERTTLDLGSVANWYVAILLIPAPPFSARHPMISRGGLPSRSPYLYPLPTAIPACRIILPTGNCLSPSQHTEAHRFLHQTPLPPCLTRTCYDCWIPNDAPLPLPKYILTSHSAASEPPFAPITARGVSSLCCSLYLCHKPQLLASIPSTPLLSHTACQCTSPVSMFPLP